MPLILEIILIFLLDLGVLLLLAWLGLRVQPRPFAAYPQQSAPLQTIPLPDGLPAPVERFYRAVYGERIPLIESAVFTGRARVRPAGPIYLPARFRFIHIAGRAYRHYIEVTLFGVPVMKINERYVDGRSLMELPGSTVDDDPKNNQGANLGLWSESLWIPAIFLTDPRLRWQPVDDATALLVAPFEDAHETYVVRFNPATGLVDFFESMRYQGPASQSKVLWLNQSLAYGKINGQLVANVGAAIWMDSGTPWAIFTVEDIAYNVDVSTSIYAKGP